MFDYEVLKLVWWVLIGVLLIGFAMTDGFDLGVGALLPFAAAVLAPETWRVAAIFALTLVSLAVTGTVSAKLGNAPVTRSVSRVVIGGSLALGATFLVGSLFGQAAL